MSAQAQSQQEASDVILQTSCQSHAHRIAMYYNDEACRSRIFPSNFGTSVRILLIKCQVVSTLTYTSEYSVRSLDLAIRVEAHALSSLKT